MRKDFGKKTIITPLPVFIIATYDENGVPNAMNAAWGTQCDYHQVVFFLGPHKTTDNLKLKKAFTVSFATKDTSQIADYFGMETGHRVDKIEKAGVHVHKSAFVDAPIIEEFPLTLECEVAQITDDLMVIGNVINMSADDSILDDKGSVDIAKLQPIAFDSAANLYRLVGESVGKAFSDGLALKK